MWFGGENSRNFVHARKMCSDCPVRLLCLERALKMSRWETAFGLWAGFSPDQLDRLRRRRVS